MSDNMENMKVILDAADPLDDSGDPDLPADVAVDGDDPAGGEPGAAEANPVLVLGVPESEEDGGQRSGGGGTKDYYLQKYKPEWEQIPEFRAWLQPVEGDPYKAVCIGCNTYLRCHKLKLRFHAKSKKHHLNMLALKSGEPSRRRPVELTPRAERRSFGRRVGGPVRGRGRARASDAATRLTTVTRAGRTAGMHHRLVQELPQDVSYGDTSRVTYSIGLGGNKVGFIGAGTMAQAIAQAILDKGVIHPSRLTVSAPSSCHLSVWSSWGCHITHCNDAVMAACDVVFLCVPTDAALEALHALTPNPEIGERCFVSVVPGLSRERLEAILASKFVPPCEPGDVQTMGSLYVVRCMLNLAVRSGVGCCAYSVPPGLPDRWLLCLEVACGAMGVSQPMDDSRLDAFAAAVSPGPALALAFCEALAMGAASLGLNWDTARKMAAQTLAGTGQLLLDSDSPAALSDQAAPAGGPALAALVALQKADMKSGVASAVQACLRAMREAAGE